MENYGFVEFENIRFVLGVAAGILIIIYFWSRNRKSKYAGRTRRDTDTEFPSRDKILFYGRKLVRKVNERRKRKAERSKNERKEEFHFRSMEFLDVDRPTWLDFDQTIPPEIIYMIRNVRVFGDLDERIFMELCRYMESRFLYASDHLFRHGDLDDGIYVIQSGRIDVYIAEANGRKSCVKEARKGESIHSLLGVLGVLTGRQSHYDKVSAVAVEDTTVLRLPTDALKSVLERFPESLVRVIQIIGIRLRRVTLLTLHNYLGLGKELFNEHIRCYSDLVECSDPLERSPPIGAAKEFEMQKQVIGVHSMDDDDAVSVDHASSAGDVNPENRAKYQICFVSHSDSSSEIDPSDGVLIKSISSSQSEGLDAQLRKSLHRQHNQTPCPDSSNTPSSVTSNLPSAEFHVTGTNAHFVIDSGIRRRSDDEFTGATQSMAALLGLANDTLIVKHSSQLCLMSGDVLVKQGNLETALYFLVDGLLMVEQEAVLGREARQELVYFLDPGSLVGSLAVLTDEPSLFTVRADRDSRLIQIAKDDFHSILQDNPKVIARIGRVVFERMSPFVRQVDFALDWIQIESGRALYRQGTRSESIYVILNGRLRSVVQSSPAGDGKDPAGEHGRGELIGLAEVLTQTDRRSTMFAVRDTELAQLPDGLLNFIKRRYPSVVTRLVRLLGQRLLASQSSKERNIFCMLSKHSNYAALEPRPTVGDLSTIAVFPASDLVPLSSFTSELQLAMHGIGSTLCLSRETVQEKLGSAALDSSNAYRLSNWLSQQEDSNLVVLYQCDPQMTAWTRRCIRQADCILIIALANQDPTVGFLEQQLNKLATRTRKELVLLYFDENAHPKNTAEWRSRREWCSAHYHVRCPKKLLTRTSPKKSKPIDERSSDFARLARILTGTAVALVLGGGAARGCAHVGVIRAMIEAGIPIDMVGGTSIGSMMGALWAQETDFVRFQRIAREWAMREMGSILRLLLDLTYPITSLLSGARFNRSIRSVFRPEMHIEDLWLPYFCVSTDVTAKKMRVHNQGSLWRYVRSSMSLAGYLPPLCDPADGHLLLDGVYVNNLPADVMKSRMIGAQTIIAVDVGRETPADFVNYGDELNGWWLLWTRWSPWAETVYVPDMAEVQARLAYVSCEIQLEEVKTADYCDYVRPPIDCYGSMQFSKFDKICEVGYEHCRKLFADWRRQGRMDGLFRKASPSIKPNESDISLHHHSSSSGVFTDLAELVSKSDETVRRNCLPTLQVKRTENHHRNLKRRNLNSPTGMFTQ